jgi:choline-sulfatase
LASDGGGRRPPGRRPNVLILMLDQLSGTYFPDGPASFLHVPNLARIAERSARFANAYTASPLCAPGRASLMTGLLPSRTGVYDNAAEFHSDLPTFAHYLRLAGYQTCLSGKMHFVGPDQLHGFEERLTTDIYPADFGWTPDYAHPDARIDWWYHNLGSVIGAGTAEITNQLDYDDEVAYHARAKLHDLTRRRDPRPWCLTVSFTHPHDPYVARQRFWDLYADCPALDPVVPVQPLDRMDPHSRRLLEAADHAAFDIRPEHVRSARRGYFASVSYVDEKIGELVEILRGAQMEDDTVIVVLSDHGDMLGERGLWFKMSFFDGSARVPLMIAAPGLPAGRIERPVSTLDLLPTLCDLCGVDPAVLLPADGASLLSIAGGGSRAPVPMEYAAEGSRSPMVALRDEAFKLTLCADDPPQLFDLAADPHELRDLAAEPAHAVTLAGLTARAAEQWDLARFNADVRASQARRRVVYAALRNGAYFPWDHQPLQLASERYMRNHMNLDTLEASRRFPPAPDG